MVHGNGGVAVNTVLGRALTVEEVDVELRTSFGVLVETSCVEYLGWCVWEGLGRVVVLCDKVLFICSQSTRAKAAINAVEVTAASVETNHLHVTAGSTSLLISLPSPQAAQHLLVLLLAYAPSIRHAGFSHHDTLRISERSAFGAPQPRHSIISDDAHLIQGLSATVPLGDPSQGLEGRSGSGGVSIPEARGPRETGVREERASAGPPPSQFSPLRPEVGGMYSGPTLPTPLPESAGSEGWDEATETSRQRRLSQRRRRASLSTHESIVDTAQSARSEQNDAHDTSMKSIELKAYSTAFQGRKVGAEEGGEERSEPSPQGGQGEELKGGDTHEVSEELHGSLPPEVPSFEYSSSLPAWEEERSEVPSISVSKGDSTDMHGAFDKVSVSGGKYRDVNTVSRIAKGKEFVFGGRPSGAQEDSGEVASSGAYIAPSLSEGEVNSLPKNVSFSSVGSAWGSFASNPGNPQAKSFLGLGNQFLGIDTALGLPYINYENNGRYSDDIVETITKVRGADHIALHFAGVVYQARGGFDGPTKTRILLISKNCLFLVRPRENSASKFVLVKNLRTVFAVTHQKRQWVAIATVSPEDNLLLQVDRSQEIITILKTIYTEEKRLSSDVLRIVYNEEDVLGRVAIATTDTKANKVPVMPTLPSRLIEERMDVAAVRGASPTFAKDADLAWRAVLECEEPPRLLLNQVAQNFQHSPPPAALEFLFQNQGTPLLPHIFEPKTNFSVLCPTHFCIYYFTRHEKKCAPIELLQEIKLFDGKLRKTLVFSCKEPYESLVVEFETGKGAVIMQVIETMRKLIGRRAVGFQVVKDTEYYPEGAGQVAPIVPVTTYLPPLLDEHLDGQEGGTHSCYNIYHLPGEPLGITYKEATRTVVVVEVLEGSPAWSAGLRRNCILLAVAGFTINTADDFRNITRHSVANKEQFVRVDCVNCLPPTITPEGVILNTVPNPKSETPPAVTIEPITAPHFLPENIKAKFNLALKRSSSATYYMCVVHKLGAKHMQERVLTVSSKALYIVDPESGVVKRGMQLGSIREVFIAAQGYIGLRIPTEYDLLFQTTKCGGKQGKTKYEQAEAIVEVLLQLFRHHTGARLQVTNIEGRPLKDFLQLKKPDWIAKTLAEGRRRDSMTL